MKPCITLSESVSGTCLSLKVASAESSSSEKMSVVDGLGYRPCFPSFRQSGTYAAPGKGRARSSTEPRAPNDPGGE